MKFSSKRQENKTFNARIIFNRMNVDNIRVEEFYGEIYLTGDSIYGQVSMVVKARGSLEFLTLPSSLKSWKKNINKR